MIDMLFNEAGGSRFVKIRLKPHTLYFVKDLLYKRIYGDIHYVWMEKLSFK